jgi:hypothetical protein
MQLGVGGRRKKGTKKGGIAYEEEFAFLGKHLAFT